MATPVKLYGTAAIAAAKAQAEADEKERAAKAAKDAGFVGLCARAGIGPGEFLHSPEFTARLHGRGLSAGEIFTLKNELTARGLFGPLA
jgi:hypothetical protein